MNISTAFALAATVFLILGMAMMRRYFGSKTSPSLFSYAVLVVGLALVLLGAALQAKGQAMRVAWFLGLGLITAGSGWFLLGAISGKVTGGRHRRSKEL